MTRPADQPARKRRAGEESYSAARLKKAWRELDAEECSQCGGPRYKRSELCKLCYLDAEEGRKWP